MQKLQASERVICARPGSFERCVSLCDADYTCPRCVLLAAFFWPSQGQWCVFSFAAKWYNLAAIFIAQSRLQGPVIHASRPGPYQAQALCFTDFNLVK